MDWREKIAGYGACVDALDWLATQPDYPTAWAVCPRGNWMLWLAGKRSGVARSKARRPLVRATCECARLALPYVRKGELRPLQAIELAERWAQGETVPRDELRTAAAAAAAAAYAAGAAAAAAYAAGDAAAAAYAAAAAAAYAAAYAAGDAAGDAAAAGDAYAAYAAAYAAAAAAGDAAAAAYAAAATAAAAAYAAAYADARSRTLAQCADIVRKHYPTPPELP
jgi:hypothetical protein